MQSQTSHMQGRGKQQPIDLEQATRIFSFRGKSVSGQGVPVALIERHYHSDVYFQDAIQTVRGRDKVIHMMNRFADRCSELRCTVHEAMMQRNVIFIEWSMDMRVGNGPILTNHGATKLTTDEQGLVVRHRDYFDLWGDMIDAFPRVSKLYRAAVQHLE